MSVENKLPSVRQIPKMRASRSRDLLILLAAGAVLALPSASYADDIPAAIFTLEATGAHGLGDASVSANGSTDGGLNTAVSSAHAVVIYYVEAVQTGNTPVPVSQVPLIFSGTVTTAASGIQAASSASFETPGGSIDACSSSTGPCGSPSASNSGTINYNALAGMIYDIEVNAGGGSGVGSGIWSASADPQVAIDPSFAYAAISRWSSAQVGLRVVAARPRPLLFLSHRICRYCPSHYRRWG